MRWVVAAGLVIGLGCMGSAWAATDDADVVQTAPHGRINWSSRTLTASSSGPPSLKAPNVAVARLGAERAAKDQAVRNLMEAVRLMGLGGKGAAGAYLDSVADARARMETLLKDFKTLDTRYFADGGVDLIVEFPIDGPLSQILLAIPKDGPTDEPVQPAADQTGLVINAKGLKAQAVLSPRLVDEKGQTLYGADTLQREALVQRGVAAYTRSLDGALKDLRVADKPVIVRALRLADSGPGDLVLGADDVAKIPAIKAALVQGKVVIVLD